MGSIILILAAFAAAFILNIRAFRLYGRDKRAAIRGEWRTPEKTLLLAAVLGGGIGAFAGMEYFRHKTKTPRFMAAVPLCALTQGLIGCAVIWRVLLTL